jgi:amino acid adenylation domain-containing protein
MEIAVIGMAGRFPRAADIDAFWRNLSQATDCISFFSDQELEAAGVDRATLEDKNYVKAGGVLDGADLFDASFFGFNAREAEITDPQQRVFLECAWEAMENAGYAGANYKHLISVYGGVSRNTYIYNLFANPDVMKSAGGFQLAVASDKDFLTPRVAYKLNLKGPAVVVQTACSTSLVAIHLACQSLLAGECQMALAGGVSIMFPQTSGYFYQAGGIYAPDGACRTFDAQSQGTVLGRGAGIVVLKRLEDALAEGDHIRAVIKGSAINNDGAFKVGFTAPGLEGQTNVIRSAHGVAEVDPETISYVEAHGTATELGDPVEVLALTKAFRAGTNKNGFCALGSVKSNIGHTDAAAGVAGFIKTVLALEHRRIPPTLHFIRPNPKIELDDSPFYVCARLTDWTTNGGPRRAGVSSFGIGGTNAHMILEEAPVLEPSGRSRLNQLLVLSAKTPSALEQLTNNFAVHLRSHPEQPLADIAFTAQMGREAFAYRRMLVSRDHESAAASLESRDPHRVLSLHSHSGDRPVVFLFPGQGTQYPEMTLGLYHEERTFHDCVDECALKLLPHLGRDLREIMYPQRDQLAEADHWLRQTALAQPALFVVEYALAKLWMEWGVQPQTMIGHSLGEYVAGTLAGIMSLDNALALVSARGSLMQSMRPGAMLAVPLPETEVAQLLGKDLSIAALNGPAMTVVSGPAESVEDLERRLASLHITGRRLHASHAFHSQMMDPMLERFADRVRKVRLQPPRIPLVSNLTGRWMSNDQAIDPNYWVRQVREAVRFGEGLSTLFEEPARVFLEVGPGATLSRLTGSHPDKPRNLTAIPSLPSAGERDSDAEVLAGALGRLWLGGVEIDWQGFYAHQHRHRVTLPTYPFERKRYWIDADPARNVQAEPAHAVDSEGDEARTNSLPAENHLSVRSRHPRPEMLVTYMPPRDEREKRLLQIWEELLGVAPIGIHDNFFELGGHSLLATQMVTALRQVFGVEFPLRRLFETPTVAELASVLAIELTNPEETSRELAQWPTLVPDVINRHEPFPLTDVQQAYWIGRTGAFALGDVATHSYLEFESANLDIKRFARAWQHLIDRHDMLRAIVLPDGQQQILKGLSAYQIEVLDLQHATRESAETELLTLRQNMSHQVRPSDRWPLFEVRASLIPGGVTRIHVSFDLLIGDAWSWNILMFELFHFYRDGRLLPPLELSFRDYVLGEIELQKTAIYERALAYWKKRLDSLPLAPDLPLRINPASLERPVFHRRSHQLPAEQWTRLKKRAVAAGLTASGVLLAAFAETLAVWCSNPRFTLNLTLFNRLPLHPQVDRLIGDFTSLTLLEADCSDAGTFEERARKLQHRLFDDLDHRYFSAVRVMRELARHRPGGNLAMMPVVFTSTLALDEKRQESSPSFALGEVVYSISQTPQVLLDHQVGEHEGSLVFNWDTVDDAFPAGLLDDIFHAYCGLLDRLSENEATWRQSSLNLVPTSQLAQHKAINEVRAAVPDDLLHTAFDRMAQQQPDRPAVIWDGGALSYGELDRRSNQLARRLRRLGARPEKLVAVSLKKGWEQVVAVLAVLRAGGAYLPVDPGLPRERRFFLLQHSEIELAVTRNAAQQEWPDGVQPLDVDDPALEQEVPSALQPVQKSTDLAYVIFTSGSTGLPKGVMIEHHGALNTVLDINRRFHVGPEDRVLALSALSFDLSVYDIFGLLAAGGAIVIPEDEKLREPAYWSSLMRQAGVTIWNSVPALMQMQVDYLEGRGERLPETLREVMLSGDWLPVTLPDQIRRNGGSVQVTSLGGATEASIWSILYPVAEVDPAWASIPYGRPMDNQTFHVFNSRLEPCPIWTPGELYIGGIGLAHGYWKDPDKTKASFIIHPLTGERLYRTGDMGRWLPDGNIEFLGREDFQVKIQGYRVELGEIELTLGQHPEVKLAIVVAAGERHGAKRLVAYVLFEEETVPPEKLSAFLRDRLPGYMVPSSFIALDALPLTANGKVDRAALPLIDQQKSTRTDELIEPRDQVEREICRIWEEVLSVSPVGLGANFFELGGHSLLAVRLMNQLKRSFGANIPMSALFRQPTVEQIASLIRKEVNINSEESLVPIQPLGLLPPFFWVHPMGGNVFCYAPLARALGKEQPFFAFQSCSQHNQPAIVGGLEKMAADYCAELQRIQPNGPYFLGGWSMGGVVAFEMARQLSSAGHQVHHLAIVDAWAPIASQIAMESDEASALIGFAGDLGIPLDRMNLGELMSLDNESRLAWIFEQAKAERILLPDDDLAHVRRLFDTFEHNRLVLATYVGKPYPGRVTLFRANENLGMPASDTLLGWGLLAEGGVELYEAEGSHFTVLSALHVSKLASTLAESVNAWRPRKPGTARAVGTTAHLPVENGN